MSYAESDSGSVSSERRFIPVEAEKRRSPSRTRKYKKNRSPNRWDAKNSKGYYKGKSNKWWSKKNKWRGKNSKSGWKNRRDWRKRESTNHAQVKTLTLDDFVPKKLYEKEEEPTELSLYQTEIFEAMLSVLNPDTPDLWRLVAFFLPAFNPDLLSLNQERLPSEDGVWRGITVSNLMYDGKIAWKKETEFFLEDGSNGSIHDARLLEQKQLLVVDETCWAYFYRKKGHPECEHSEYQVVSLLKKARIPF